MIIILLSFCFFLIKFFYKISIYFLFSFINLYKIKNNKYANILIFVKLLLIYIKKILTAIF
jgi:hypothetical protein